ncbi:MAG: DUF4402 domain-containing protein [Sphingomonadales bacterium]|nr:DUF4402 domain-containing protein [Sphingomonadales bacterium]
MHSAKRNFRLCCVAVAVAQVAPAATFAAESGAQTAHGQAAAQVIAPLTVIAIRDLDFGTVSVAAGMGGSVEVLAGGAAPRYLGAAGLPCVAGGGCTPHPAKFIVSGEPGRRYHVDIPAVADAKGSAANAAHLLVGDLHVRSASLAGAGAAGMLDGSGSDDFEIGGTLQIPAGTVADHYTAKIPVIVTYG